MKRYNYYYTCDRCGERFDVKADNYKMRNCIFKKIFEKPMSEEKCNAMFETLKEIEYPTEKIICEDKTIGVTGIISFRKKTYNYDLCHKCFKEVKNFIEHEE